MDIQIPFIFVSLFSLASVMLIFIYKFGIKEKSYEEAIAEQRQQTHILLGMKPKSKDKKNKKLSKKVKEKSSDNENSNLEKTETIATENNVETQAQKKPHVEFNDVPEEVSVKNNNTVNKKQIKKEKMRPILIHKESTEKEVENIVNDENVPLPINHFEELHPKDDFELFKSNGHPEENSKEETEKNQTNNKQLKIETDSKKQSNKKEPEIVQPAPLKENNASLTVNPPVNGIINNSGKEKKKKKSEFNTLQQLAGDTNGPNMSVLLNLVRKAELSRSEVQILIDLLLNKQHETPVIMDEWSEGKSDPVQKLKKQLAEKEKLLLEEQQLVSSTQTKLREIRAEHQTEKSLLQQKIRSLDEAFQGKQIEITRLHQQLQQLQAQIQEESLKGRKSREEIAATQLQRQQIEMRLAQAQEAEDIMKNEVQELSSLNNQLRMELTRLNEENRTEKDCQQSFIVQLNNFQKEMEQALERNRQLEESRVEAEHNLETILKQENDLKAEISHLNSSLQQQNEEIRRLERGKKQYQDELQKYKDESNKSISQLKSEIQALKEENTQMQAQAIHMNGSLQENKQHEVEILNLHNELSSIKSQLNEAEKKNETELNAANALVLKLQDELGNLRTRLEEEKIKLEEQKIKNNELRTKNWKVMEALNAAESRIKAIAHTKSDKEIQREFVQRLFPEIKELGSITSDEFEVDCQKYIRKYIDDLRKDGQESTDEVAQLKSQLQHYKSVIDKTEKILNKLQKHIEQEEIKWRMQLAAKSAELESLKESYAVEFQEKLSQLEKALKEEQEDKNRIIIQFQEYKNNCQNGIEKLPEAQYCNPSNGLH